MTSITLSGLTTASVELRLQWVKKSIALFLLLGICLSPNLWLSNRFFPMAPVFDCLSINSFLFDAVIMTLLVCSLVTTALFKNRLVIYLNICLLTILLLQDQMRWQPWVFIYFLLFIFFAAGNDRSTQATLLSSVQILLIGVYIWSGVHKLNPNFIDNTFTNILTKLFQIKNKELIDSLQPLGHVIPLIEIFVGVALFTRRFRNLGVMLSILSHIFIMVYLSPLGINDNYVVYPWNFAMMALVFFAFFRMYNSVISLHRSHAKVNFLKAGAILLFWLAPALNLFGLWDNYLSFSLFSDKVHSYYIAVETQEVSKIDKRLSKAFAQIKGLSGGELIDLNKWAMTELNVPFNPEGRIFRKVIKPFCQLEIPEERIIFLEITPPLQKGHVNAFKCTEVK